ncbi:MgPa adhesin [Mycoplasmoides genitalium M6320]|uniref:MgPa adhesin n=1 Tax=Mycoplasmoides genitalium M6320 TaxID=662945 RepID=A0ABC7ZIV2_MYCGT|nr:MgPa adhesin [Mycoplasmoides genitalium M6320]
MITQHLNKENTRWVFTPGSTPDIWTGAGYRVQSANQKNGIPFDNVKPSNGSTPFDPNSDDNKVTSGSSSKNNHLHPFTQQYQSHQWLKQCIDFH